MAQAQQVATGNALAQQAITEAVIATLLRAFPPLAVELHASLALTAQEYRPDLQDEDRLVHSTFDKRIAQAKALVEAFSAS